MPLLGPEALGNAGRAGIGLPPRALPQISPERFPPVLPRIPDPKYAGYASQPIEGGGDVAMGGGSPFNTLMAAAALGGLSPSQLVERLEQRGIPVPEALRQQVAQENNVGALPPMARELAEGITTPRPFGAPPAERPAPALRSDRSPEIADNTLMPGGIGKLLRIPKLVHSATRWRGAPEMPEAPESNRASDDAAVRAQGKEMLARDLAAKIGGLLNDSPGGGAAPGRSAFPPAVPYREPQRGITMDQAMEAQGNPELRRKLLEQIGETPGDNPAGEIYGNTVALQNALEAGDARAAAMRPPNEARNQSYISPEVLAGRYGGRATTTSHFDPRPMPPPRSNRDAISEGTGEVPPEFDLQRERERQAEIADRLGTRGLVAGANWGKDKDNAWVRLAQDPEGESGIDEVTGQPTNAALALKQLARKATLARSAARGAAKEDRMNLARQRYNNRNLMRGMSQSDRQAMNRIALLQNMGFDMDSPMGWGMMGRPDMANIAHRQQQLEVEKKRYAAQDRQQLAENTARFNSAQLKYAEALNAMPDWVKNDPEELRRRGIVPPRREDYNLPPLESPKTTAGGDGSTSITSKVDSLERGKINALPGEQREGARSIRNPANFDRITDSILSAGGDPGEQLKELARRAGGKESLRRVISQYGVGSQTLGELAKALGVKPLDFSGMGQFGSNPWLGGDNFTEYFETEVERYIEEIMSKLD